MVGVGGVSGAHSLGGGRGSRRRRDGGGGGGVVVVAQAGGGTPGQPGGSRLPDPAKGKQDRVNLAQF